MKPVLILRTACVAVVIAAFPQRASAQPKSADRTAAGHLSLALGEKTQPLAGAWVTLHRVGRDSAGPVDSMRTAAGGGFRFRYRAWGDTAAVYFVSSRYGGIAYFSSPLSAHTTAPGDADLIVYDTTSVRAPINVASRHIVVSAPDASGARQIVEVYVLLNGSGLTRVAGRASATTFESELPSGAEGMQAREGDVPAQAMAFANGRMTVTAPIAPGTKRLTYGYRLPASGGDLAFPALASSDILEVMVEDPAGEAIGAGLHEEAPVAVSGRTFRRFIGHDVAASTVVRVRAQARVPGSVDIPRAFAVIAAALAMVVALIVAQRRDGTANGDAALAPPVRAE